MIVLRLVPLVLIAGAGVAAATEPVPVVNAGGWPMFRGNPSATGVANDPLPEKLQVLWKFEASEAFSSTAAIVDGVVYVGCEDGVLYALDLQTGAVKWTLTTGDMIRSSPTVLSGTVYFGDGLGVLHAVDAKSGKSRWTYATKAEIISSVNHADGRLIFGSYDGFIYCLDARDGKLLWKFETGGRVHGTPGITRDAVVAAGCDEFLHVLRLADGKSLARISLHSVSGASAAIGGSHAFVGTFSNQVLGINWSKGKVEWVFEDEERQFPFMSSAALTDGLVIVGGRDKRLWALDRETGKPRWKFVTQGRIDSSPVVVGERVFVGSSDGRLYAVRLDTGTEVWRFDAGSPITASPAVAAGRLVVGTLDGLLYCFGAKREQ